MSVLAYTGLPGHGKSYSVVENVIIPALKEGRIVAHNLELVIPSLNVVCGREVRSLLVEIPKDATADDVVARCPPGALVVLDEVWRYWGAGLKVSDVPKHQMAFFKEHRHRVGDDGLSTEIVILDQELGSGVARFIRDLVETTYIHTKHSRFGSNKTFFVDAYNRGQCADKPSKGAHLRRMVGRYKPEVWNCYVSHTQSKRIGEAGLEKMADKRGSIWKSWTALFTLIALIAAPFLIWRAADSFHHLGGKPKVTAPVRASGAHQPSPLAQPVGGVAVAAKPASTRWRLAGVIQGLEANVAFLVSPDGGRRIPAGRCKRSGMDWSCEVDGELVDAWTGAVAPPDSAGSAGVGALLR